MKHLFIINPAAGKYNHTEQLRDRISEAAAGLDYEIVVTTAPKHATQIVRAAADTGEEYRVYSCGGDGTLNEVINGAACRENISVTQLPTGSGNDFIKIFSDGGKSFKDVENLFDCDEAAFDLIRCNDRYSCNICSIGLDARIGTSIDKYKRLPLVTGKGAYLISTLVNVIKGIHDHYRIEIDGQVFDSRFTLICIAVGRWYGGSFNPLPESLPDDGLLDVLLVKDVSRLTVPKVIKKFASGQHAAFPELMSYFRCHKVSVKCDKVTDVNLDGELMHSEQVDMEVVPGALRFFYPRGLTWSYEPEESGAILNNREISAIT